MFRKTIAAVALVAVAALGTVPAAARHYDDRDGYRRGHDRHYDHDRRGYDDRRCRNSGTGGAIIGGVAGGLLGNAIAGRGDKTLGTVLGAGGGALAGNAIARNGTHRC